MPTRLSLVVSFVSHCLGSLTPLHFDYRPLPTRVLWIQRVEYVHECSRFLARVEMVVDVVRPGYFHNGGCSMGFWLFSKV